MSNIVEHQEHALLEARSLEEWGHSEECEVCYPEYPSQEDPRAKGENLCRHIRIFGQTEFICVKKKHRGDPNKSRQPNHVGYYPESERHVFVNRWPNRPRDPSPIIEELVPQPRPDLGRSR